MTAKLEVGDKLLGAIRIHLWRRPTVTVDEGKPDWTTRCIKCGAEESLEDPLMAKHVRTSAAGEDRQLWGSRVPWHLTPDTVLVVPFYQ